MGFPFMSYGILLSKPIEDLLDIWAHVKHMIMVALFCLGLLDPTNFSPSWEDHGRRPLESGPHELSSPITPESVKKSLPIVEFADFVERSWPFEDVNDDGDDGEPICTVCLSRLEGGHEIRELWNCSHVFHVECLDRWVDQRHMTCPLCRSSLLPEEEDVKKGRKDSWMVERIAYLFGEDLMAMGNDF